MSYRQTPPKLREQTWQCIEAIPNNLLQCVMASMPEWMQGCGGGNGGNCGHLKDHFQCWWLHFIFHWVKNVCIYLLKAPFLALVLALPKSSVISTLTVQSSICSCGNVYFIFQHSATMHTQLLGLPHHSWWQYWPLMRSFKVQTGPRPESRVQGGQRTSQSHSSVATNVCAMWGGALSSCRSSLFTASHKLHVVISECPNMKSALTVSLPCRKSTSIHPQYPTKQFLYL